MLSKVTIDKYHKEGADFFVLSIKGNPTKEERAVIVKINELIETLSNSSDESSESDHLSTKKQRGSKPDLIRDSKYEI